VTWVGESQGVELPKLLMLNSSLWRFTDGEMSWVSVWMGDCFFSEQYLGTEKA